MEKEHIQPLVESWLEELSKELNTTLALESGICTLEFEGKGLVTIELSDEYPLLYMYSPLLPFPKEEKQISLLMARALEMNAFQALTRGGSIGTLPGGGLFIYSLTIPVEGLDAASFGQTIMDVYETAAAIKGYLLGEAPFLQDNVEPGKHPGMKI